MIAVLAKAEQADLPAILLRLFSALVQDGVANLDGEPKACSDIVANDLMDSFWVLVEQEMGYRDGCADAAGFPVPDPGDGFFANRPRCLSGAVVAFHHQ
jgi:hypothetical protein